MNIDFKTEIDKRGLKRNFIADKLGIKNSILSDRLSGRSEWKPKELYILSKILGFNLENVFKEA